MIIDPDGDVYLGYSDAHYAHRKIKQLRQRMSQLRVDDASEIRGILTMIDQLERDIGRSLLMLHATIDLLVENKVITREQLAAKAEALDKLDDETDGRLDPALFRSEEELNTAPSAKLHLHRLENEVHESPGEFLKGLEGE